MPEQIDPMEDLAPDHDAEGDSVAPVELAMLLTHEANIVPDNVDQKETAQ